MHWLVITPEIHFTLPTPSITLTLAAVCEIVLECDARLTSKDTFQAFYDNAFAKVKAQLKEVFSDPIWGRAAIYGYRVIQEPPKIGMMLRTSASSRFSRNTASRSWPLVGMECSLSGICP